MTATHAALRGAHYAATAARGRGRVHWRLPLSSMTVALL